MFFEFNDWLYGPSLTKVPFFKGIIILCIGGKNFKFVPWWKVKIK